MSIADRIIQRARKSHSPLLDQHPELVGRVHVFQGGTDKEVTNPPTYQKKAAWYSTRQWVKKAIDVWATNIAPLRINVVKGEVGQAEIVPNHTLNQVLEIPNPQIDRAEFWSEWAVEMGFAGEYGLQVTQSPNGQVLELWPRQSIDITVKTGPQGKRFREVVGYIIQDGEDNPSEFTVPPDEFIFYKFYNPTQVFRGLSRLTALRLSIDIDLGAQLWSRNFFLNSARPDYAVVAPEGITPSERKEIITDILNRFKGVGKAHLPLVLEKGITDIKTLSFPPKDLEWIEQRKISRDEIGGVFGIPDEIMGFGRDTFENFATADRVLWTNTLVPLIRFRDNMLSFFFKKHTELLGPNERIWTDLSQVPQLQEDISSKIDQFKILTDQGVPPRTAMDFLLLGVPPYNGDNIGYVSSVLIPATSSKGTKGTLPDMIKDAIEAKFKEINEPVSKNVPEFGSDEHKAVVEARQRLLFPLQNKMAALLKKYFQRQQTEFNARLRGDDGKQFGRGKWVDKQDEIPPIDPMTEFAKEVEIFEAQFRPIIEESYSIVAEGWWEELEQAGEFDILADNVQASISKITNMQAILVNQTTFSSLGDIFTNAEREGLGLPAIQEQVNAFFGGRKSAFETERIARTTMNLADNTASQIAWLEAEVVRTKIWVSALLAGRTRDAHAAAHGQEVPLNESFEVGGEQLFTPGDPSGSAGNIINCLCVMIPGGIEA